VGIPGPHSADRLRRQYSFGDVTLDLDEGFLRRGGDVVALRPKPFEVLVYLVQHHGRLVTKAELTDAVWPNTVVVENSLAQCLVEIRKALGDDSQQTIRTVSRRGYVFAASVSAPVAEFPRVPGTVAIDADPAALAGGRTAVTLPKRYVALGTLALLAIVGVMLPLVWSTRTAKRDLTYTQLTNFTDSVVSPALSPDGRMVAFIRSENWWLTTDQIYVKLLPDGEPVQVTHDPRPKYAPAFSPDGSRIVYNVPSWSTYTVSPLGGEPSLFLTNSSGVTWVDRHRILFSEVNPPQSVHMGLVTALEDRSEKRAVYFPPDDRGMVHLSYPSPDHQWAVVLEMNPVWQRCRVVPLDGRGNARQVGPTGACTSAGWSPDGQWMYFGVEVNGSHHLWRQRFAYGNPEQITFGPTDEDGVAVAPDGRSLITSIGMQQSEVWIHDTKGDRALSFQGHAVHPSQNGLAGSIPVFSRDGKTLFYLKRESAGAPNELWKSDVASQRSEKAIAGVSILEFDISDDASEVVYSTQPAGKSSQIWLFPLDRSSPPRLIYDHGGDSPRFGPDGRIVFRSFDGTSHHLELIRADGSGRVKANTPPIGTLLYTSPDRRWAAVIATSADGLGGTYAVPFDGGAARRICSGCSVMWSPDGKFLHLSVPTPSPRTSAGQTRVVRIPPGEMLPSLPPFGMHGLDDANAFPGSYLIDAYGISPSPDASVYAYVKTTMHRNLFRIPLQ